MKYKVSVIKLVTLVMMIGALAVAMVACTGAATGPAGPPGEQGPPGPAAPTPEPADPAEPTTPEPAGPTGAAPMVSTPFPHVYLALEGDGNPKTKVIDLDAHITDSDSRVKFSAMSSDSMIATATPPEGGRTVTITPVRVGTVTVTVTARDGDNPPLMEDISVTVVRNNVRPDTNDLSKADRDELEKTLYVNDGARPHTVTVAVRPGGTSMETVEDEISDTFKVAYGDKKEKTSKYVSVSVAKHATAKDKYVITVTPTEASWDKSLEKIFIYPMDMFEAASSEAWEFTAMFNKRPKRLVARFDTVRLHRPIKATPAAVGDTVPVEGIDIVEGSDGNVNVAVIEIADYFDIESLDRMVKGIALTPDNITALNTAGDLSTGNATVNGTIDEVGDTVCEVTYSTSLAVVQWLNEAGAELNLSTEGEEATDAIVTKHLLVERPEALAAIRIDSRVSDMGNDMLVQGYAPTATVELGKHDTRAEGEGAFDVTIRCADKDHTAEVTGTVVVRQLS